MSACRYGNKCRRHDCRFNHPDNRDNRPECRHGDSCHFLQSGMCFFKHSPQLTVAETVIPYYGYDPPPTPSSDTQLTPNDYLDEKEATAKIDVEKELCPGGWPVEDGPYGPLGERSEFLSKGNCRWCGGGKIKCERFDTDWIDFWRPRVKKIRLISLCEPCCTKIKRCEPGVWSRWE